MRLRTLIKKRSNSWRFLKNFLDGEGYAVYPTEITCHTAHCKFPDRSFVADVAAKKHGDYYAFEYKSLGDSITSKRLMEQISNYSVSFDYVIVVAEVASQNGEYYRPDASINPKRGLHMRKILKKDAGFWTVFFPHHAWNPGKPPIFNEIAQPKRQQPHPENKQWIINKFNRYVFGIPTPINPNQRQITNYV